MKTESPACIPAVSGMKQGCCNFYYHFYILKAPGDFVCSCVFFLVLVSRKIRYIMPIFAILRQLAVKKF
jgi:hypothetical protein